MNDLDPDKSTVAGIHDDPPEGFDPADGVLIMEQVKGVAHYAVFDEGEQVSDTAGPLNEDYIMTFVEAYSTAKRRHA